MVMVVMDGGIDDLTQLSITRVDNLNCQGSLIDPIRSPAQIGGTPDTWPRHT